MIITTMHWINIVLSLLLWLLVGTLLLLVFSRNMTAPIGWGVWLGIVAGLISIIPARIAYAVMEAVTPRRNK